MSSDGPNHENAKLTIDLVRHMKARNREKWDGDDGERPLRKIGRKQAAFQVDAMLEGDPILALYSSPAWRCRQTLQPLAERLELPLTLEPLLADVVRLIPSGAELPWLTRLREAHPRGGRVVGCGHADTIPAFLQALGPAGIEDVPGMLKGFGGWLRLRLDLGDGDASVERIEAPAGFPS